MNGRCINYNVLAPYAQKKQKAGAQLYRRGVRREYDAVLLSYRVKNLKLHL